MRRLNRFDYQNKRLYKTEIQRKEQWLLYSEDGTPEHRYFNCYRCDTPYLEERNELPKRTICSECGESFLVARFSRNEILQILNYRRSFWIRFWVGITK